MIYNNGVVNYMIYLLINVLYVRISKIHNYKILLFKISHLSFNTIRQVEDNILSKSNISWAF